MALSEMRGHLTTGELIADASTQQEQVWFMGLHGDVGGGLPSKGPAHISLGWMADKAEEAGLLLPDGWRSTVEPVDFIDDVHAERDPSEAFDQPDARAGLLAIRNPARCRGESGQEGPVMIHRSVQDRMTSNPGWVPLPWCCTGLAEAVTAFGIEWVSTSHYAHATVTPQQPQWVRVRFGRLLRAEVPELLWAPRYYVTAQNWHSSVPLEDGSGAQGGCCSVHRGDPILRDSLEIVRHGSWWWPTYTANLDFTGLELVLPVERALADQIIIEIHEDDLSNDDFVGRVALSYDADRPGGMQLRDIDGAAGDATLEVQFQFVEDDASIQAVLRAGPAQCGWAWAHLGRAAGLCGRADDNFNRALEVAGVAVSKTCEDYKLDLTEGAI